MANKKNENLLTTLARKVGATAGAIVVKTTQLKDDVVKAGSATLSRPTEKPTAKKSFAKKPATKKSVVKKVAARKTGAKKAAPRATAKKKTAGKASAKRK